MSAIDHEITVNKSVLQIAPLNAALRAALGSAISGVTVGGGAVRVHFLIPPGAGDALAENLISEHNVLAVASSKTQITADGVDEALISCAQLGNNFDYLIWQENKSIAVGSVADGLLELSAVESGVYLVEIKAPTGHQTGYVTVEANSV
jgi:hypothetical protein